MQLLKHDELLGKTTLNIRGRLVDLSEPAIMGIINLTPDSFYKASRAQSSKEALQRAEKMLEDGATFLDLGAYSTRPGASEISQEDEKARIIPIVKEICRELPNAIISVDTFRSEIAREVLDLGASMINDITAGSDDAMAEVIKSHHVPYIIMHMRGQVTNMMDNLIYSNLLEEMTDYFKEKIKLLDDFGVTDIIIDPGFGFSKSLDQNYEVFRNLSYFKALEKLILVGVSRKSMIYKLLDNTPEDTLPGTSVLNFAALEKGARILRVHDVGDAVNTIKLYSKIRH